MPYLIDGHNLIPTIPGLSLKDVDDEIQLIQLLQVYQQHIGKKIEVYFDNAPAGHNRTQRYGSVTAHFISQNSSADSAIQSRLEKLGGAANTWTVVSSDRQVQAAARAFHAQVIRSADFAKEMTSPDHKSLDPKNRDDISLSPEEIEEWMTLFGKSKE